MSIPHSGRTITQRSLSHPSQWVCPKCYRSARPATTYTKKKIVPEVRPREAYRPPDPGPKGWGWWKKEAPVLKPLTRPLGQPNPPRLGENKGKDDRSYWTSFRQFFSKEKKEERRKNFQKQMTSSYIQDWASLRFHKGKTFLATPKLFKAELAMFFPNLQGYTLLDKPGIMTDTTKVLRDRISIVSVSGVLHGEQQVETFVGEKENPALAELMKTLQDQGLQRVKVQFEDNLRTYFWIWLFHGRRKRGVPKEDWGRTFMVRMGFHERIRHSISVTNKLTGHVYLVDRECRIRWYGNGHATDEEREQLVSAVRRLVELENDKDVGKNPAGGQKVVIKTTK